MRASLVLAFGFTAFLGSSQEFRSSVNDAEHIILQVRYTTVHLDADAKRYPMHADHMQEANKSTKLLKFLLFKEFSSVKHAMRRLIYLKSSNFYLRVLSADFKT